MMKKLFVMLIVSLLTLSVVGCGLFPAASTESLTTTAYPTTFTWPDVETTEDARIARINEKYQEFSSSLPTEFSASIILPEIDATGYSIEYYLNDVILTDNILDYLPKSYDEAITITLKITYQGLTLNFDYEILQLRDETLYNEEQTNIRFDAIVKEIEAMIPEVIFSDFTIPNVSIVGVETYFFVDKSYIYHDRLIFTFPETDEVVNLGIDITYNRQMRRISLPIIMSDFYHLPKIPEIYIITDDFSPIETKEEYVFGYLDLFSYDQYNNSVMELGGARIGIKLRGNSTMFMPKLPYKIKFETKQEMLGDYAEKDWVLLANFADQTLVRNALAFNLSKELNLEFTPSVNFVDLYINGVYQGNYLLTDQIEVTNNRVDIEENSPAIDTGYLIEYDMRLYDVGLDNATENYFMVDYVPMVIKSPDISDSHYSNDQYLFIKDYMNNLYQVLRNKGDYSGLIDEASFIDWFIVNEFLKNVDSSYSSVYFHKDKSGLLKMGPVWDFDLSSGNYGHLQEDLRGPEGWYTARYDKNIFFLHLMEYPAFRANLKARWNEVYDLILANIESIYPMIDAMARSRYLNFELWDVIGTNSDWYTAPEIFALDTYEEQVFFLVDFLTKRAEWLNQNINNL
ncbi:MAG TPA: CotH kinase family protein [Bacillota bacterium]|nr:CotH kinase family protein [Bacillota bacterium]